MKTITLFAVLATALISLQLSAQNTKQTGDFPNEELAFIFKNGIKYGVAYDTPLVLAGISDNVEGETASQKAFNWLIVNMDLLKIDDLANLKVYSVKNGPAGDNVRLRQYLNGIPVYNSEIIIHISKKNQVTYVANTYNPTLESISTEPAFTEEEALELSRLAIEATGRMNYSSSELQIYDYKGTTALIYRIILEPEAPLGSWEVLISADYGTILKVINKTCNHQNEYSSFAPPPVDGTGNVFLPDPLSTALVPYGTPYADNSDATNASLDATLMNVSLLDINFDGSQYELVGPYAEIVDFENPWKGLFSQASPNFNFNRNDDGFEAVNCYYHIDNSMRYINEILTITCLPFQYPGGVQYDPSGLNGQDNSHYLGGSGRVSFGEGGVDDAEDADVILHELGHGIHDWLTNGNLSQVNGLSEGCGDYWATSYSRSLNQWTPADPEYNWMFSWDGHNPFWNGRITNYTAIYPSGLTGAIHTDGQIWCTALMRIYDLIGREKVDRAFLEGLAMTGSNTSQQDAAIAVRQAAIDMNYSCADIDVFTQEFTATGYVLPALTPPSGTENSTLCYGESITVNGTIYDASNPTGTEVISGPTAACDSTVTINLTVLPELSSSIITSLCDGESIIVNGNTYDVNNPSGIEIFSNIGPNGCDSTVTIDLTFNNTASSTISGSLCDGESVIVNGNLYDASNPNGTEILTAAAGCDSVVTINLTPIAPINVSVDTILCNGESIVVNGTIYDASNPTGTEIFTSVDGCDSTVSINLNFESAIDISVTNTQPNLQANQVGAMYQWIDCNNGNQAIIGETNQDFTATANGLYAVEISLGNCTETSNCESVTNVGIEELDPFMTIIHPNPSSGQFIVTLSSNFEDVDCYILDAQGRIIRTFKNIASNFVLDLHNECRGVYFLNLGNQDFSKVYKLILE